MIRDSTVLDYITIHVGDTITLKDYGLIIKTRIPLDHIMQNAEPCKFDICIDKIQAEGKERNMSAGPEDDEPELLKEDKVVLRDESTFYLVWNPRGGNNPSVKHPTFEDAKSEAVRLARHHPGSRFFVLKALGQAASDLVSWSAIDD